MQKDTAFKLIDRGNSSVLYDDSIIAEPDLTLFDNDQASAASGTGIGRAKVVYFQHEGRAMVLKHYYRGGLVSALVKDKYLGFNVERTRSFKEWCLLNVMKKLDLPVPVAVAAHAEKYAFYFRCDLVTLEIENASTLADVLSDHAFDSKSWQKVGRCIRKFHDKNVYHADLNARNILLDDKDGIYLIDFDNSYIRSGASAWKEKNLLRLKRSLNKFKDNSTDFNFHDNNWLELLAGYNLSQV